MSQPSPPIASATDATVDTGTALDEVDVREVPKPRRHPLIFARFDALAVGESFVLINSHDPKHLRQEFERDHPAAYDWHYLSSGDSDDLNRADRLWRIRITRLTGADLPRVLGDTHALTTAGETGRTGDVTAGGAVWKLKAAQRQLDANVIRLRPQDRIEAHIGPDLDVLLHVLAGSGELTTATGTVELTGGRLVWLPRRSHRAITAGPDGLSYLTVHPRRPGLSVGPAGP